jgi:hypothetical protein
VNLKFIVWWNGEPAAGIRSGSEEVTIQFKHGVTLDEDTVAFWKDSVSQYFDGAHVEQVPN